MDNLNVVALPLLCAPAISGIGARLFSFPMGSATVHYLLLIGLVSFLPWPGMSFEAYQVSERPPNTDL